MARRSRCRGVWISIGVSLAGARLTAANASNLTRRCEGLRWAGGFHCSHTAMHEPERLAGRCFVRLVWSAILTWDMMREFSLLSRCVEIGLMGLRMVLVRCRGCVRWRFFTGERVCSVCVRLRERDSAPPIPACERYVGGVSASCFEPAFARWSGNFMLLSLRRVCVCLCPLASLATCGTLDTHGSPTSCDC